MPRPLLLAAACILSSLAPAFAETQPRASVDQYPAHAAADGLALGAEFFGRSAPGGQSGFFTGYYVVVEVAAFPAKGRKVTLRPSDFRLSVNGAKVGLMPESGSMVAASLAEYQGSGPNLQVGAGPILIGGRPRVPTNIPEDPGGSPVPHPQAPDQNPVPPDQRTVPDDPAKALPMLGLEEGTASEPRSGYLYFYWKANTKKIKTLDLRWEPEPAGAPPKAVLRLLP